MGTDEEMAGTSERAAQEIREEKYLYLATSGGKLELPVCVADSVEELAKVMNTTDSAIRSAIYKYEHGMIKRTKWHRVPLEE